VTTQAAAPAVVNLPQLVQSTNAAAMRAMEAKGMLPGGMAGRAKVGGGHSRQEVPESRRRYSLLFWISFLFSESANCFFNWHLRLLNADKTFFLRGCSGKGCGEI